LEARAARIETALAASLRHHVEAEAVEADATAVRALPEGWWSTILRVFGAPLHADRDGPWFTRAHAAVAASLFAAETGGGAVPLAHGLDLHRLGSRVILARRAIGRLPDLVL